MGLFSSKKKTRVGTVIARVIEDEALPNAVHSGVLEAIVAGGDIPAYTNESLVNCLGITTKRMYNWAKDNYVHGLPAGQFVDATQYVDQVKAVLEEIHDAEVTINYSRIAPANVLHHGWKELVNSYGYDQFTNEIAVLSADKEFPVYLKDMQIVVPEPVAEDMTTSSFDQWGTAPRSGYTPTRVSDNAAFNEFVSFSPVIVDRTVTEEHLLVTYVWQEPDPDPNETKLVDFEETLTIPFEGYDEEEDYFQVRYVVDGQTKYWTYKLGSGTFPTLDAVYLSPPAAAGQFYPWMYYRYGKVSENENPESDSYKHNVKLAKILGIDYDTVAESVNANEDIADVEQAIMMFAVEPEAKSQPELRYLFRFFDNMFNSTGRQFRNDVVAQLQETYNRRSLDLIRTAHIIEDERFKMTLRTGGVYKRRIAGKIGKKDTYKVIKSTEIVTVPYFDTTAQQELEYDLEVVVYAYQRQVSAGLIDEIKVVDLEMMYHVFGKYHTTSDDTEGILLVPLDHSLIEDFSVPDKELLYARSLHFVFNSLVVQKVKWYESSFFRFVLIVAAVVITVISFGQGWQTLVAAVNLGTVAAVTAAVWVILKQLLINLVIGYAFKLFVKEVGVEIGFYLAIAAAVLGGVDALRSGGIQGAPFATDLLMVSTGLTTASQEVMQDLVGELLQEYSEFEKYVQEQLETLENAQKLLSNTTPLSPFVLFGESPEDYYNRTVHSGNIGTYSVSAIEYYVESALTLPKLSDTIGAADGGPLF